jgi:hypothetical protein
MSLEEITIEQAIARGELTVNYPVLVIMLVFAVIYNETSSCFHSSIYSIGMLILSFVLPWLYWSWAITKWRIWAYERIEDIEELKLNAVKAKLIWPDGHILERTEIRSIHDMHRLKELSNKNSKL